jgi:hypothetical protein
MHKSEFLLKRGGQPRSQSHVANLCKTGHFKMFMCTYRAVHAHAQTHSSACTCDGRICYLFSVSKILLWQLRDFELTYMICVYQVSSEGRCSCMKYEGMCCFLFRCLPCISTSLQIAKGQATVAAIYAISAYNM